MALQVTQLSWIESNLNFAIMVTIRHLRTLNVSACKTYSEGMAKPQVPINHSLKSHAIENR